MNSVRNTRFGFALSAFCSTIRSWYHLKAAPRKRHEARVLTALHRTRASGGLASCVFMQLHSSHRVSGLSVCKSTGWSDSLARLRAHTQVVWRAWCARMYTSQLADLSALNQAAWCVVSKLTDYVDFRSIVRPSPGPYCHLPRAPSPTTLSPFPAPPATLISTRHRSSLSRMAIHLLTGSPSFPTTTPTAPPRLL